MNNFIIIPAENIISEIKRIFYENIKQILQLIQNKKNDNIEIIVHDVRKEFKKLRAILRFIKNGISDDLYDKLNLKIRNMASEISESRDITIIGESIQLIIDSEKNNKYNTELDELLNKINKEKKEIFNTILQNNILLSIESELKEILTNSIVINDNIRSLFLGLKDTYKQGRIILNKAIEEKNDENIHEFRKALKYLLNQLYLLQDLAPDHLIDKIVKLDELSENTGNDHDLAVFKEYIRQFFPENQDDPFYKYLVEKAISIQQELRENIWSNANIIYSNEPNIFIKQIKDYSNLP